MAHVESKETIDTNQKQVDGEKAREPTDHELAKVSGGVSRLLKFDSLWAGGNILTS